MAQQRMQTRGEKIAKKLEKRRYLVIFSEVLVVIYILIAQIVNVSYILVLPCLLLFAGLCMYWNSRGNKQIGRVLTHDLDPALFKEYMEYKRGSTAKQAEKDAYSVHIAAALVWQGYTKNAYQVIRQIDFKQLPEDFIYEGYLVCCHYFFELKNVALLKEMKQLYDNELKIEAQPDAYRKLCETSACTVNLYLSILEGSSSEFDGYLAKYEKLADVPLKKVFARYLYMLMCIREGRLEEAGKAADEVIAVGGKLCLAQRARNVQDDIAAGRKVWEFYGPVYTVPWNPDDLVKDEVNYAYFKKNIKYDLRLRIAYAVVIPLAFFIGFAVGVFQTADIMNGQAYLILSLLCGVSYMMNANAFMLMLTCFISRRQRKIAAVFMVVGIFFFSAFMLLSSIVIIPYYIYNAVKLAQEWSQNRRLLNMGGK